MINRLVCCTPRRGRVEDDVFSPTDDREARIIAPGAVHRPGWFDREQQCIPSTRFIPSYRIYPDPRRTALWRPEDVDQGRSVWVGTGSHKCTRTAISQPKPPKRFTPKPSSAADVTTAAARKKRSELTMTWTVACFCGNVYAAPPDRCDVCGRTLETAVSGGAATGQIRNAAAPPGSFPESRPRSTTLTGCNRSSRSDPSRPSPMFGQGAGE